MYVILIKTPEDHPIIKYFNDKEEQKNQKDCSKMFDILTKTVSKGTTLIQKKVDKQLTAEQVKEILHIRLTRNIDDEISDAAHYFDLPAEVPLRELTTKNNIMEEDEDNPEVNPEGEEEDETQYTQIPDADY